MRRALPVLLPLLAALLLTLATPGDAAAALGKRQVAAYQRTLNHLGCGAGRADGRIDAHVRAAVTRFQTRFGLTKNGHFDTRTRRALGVRTARCSWRPVPARSGHGRRIVVGQWQDWVWLVRADGSIAAQGGMIDNPKVLHKGTYATGSYCGRAARIRRNTDVSGRLWLPYFVRFAPCGIGFHQIPLSKSTGRRIHADWLLGTDQRSSHGCNRVSHRLATRIWDFTAGRRRTTVVVR